MNISEIILVSVTGGVIALDRTALFQVMISRPIVAAPIIGFVLGDPVTGLKAGLVIELLWIGQLPVGTSIPPDETMVSILVSAISIWGKQFVGGSSEASVALTFILVTPAAILAQRMDHFIRNQNIVSAHAADKALNELNYIGIEKACLHGIKRFFLGYFLMIFVVLTIGAVIIPFTYPLISGPFLTGLNRFYYVLPAIGIISLLSSAKSKKSFPLFIISFILFFGLFEALNK